MDFDGLRLDAADQIYDRGPTSILSEIVEVAHREAERRGFPAYVFAENDMNDARRSSTRASGEDTGSMASGTTISTMRSTSW